MEIEINWFRAFFNFSEGINWFVASYLLIMWRCLTPPFKWLTVVFIHITLGVAFSNSVYIFFDLNNRFIAHLRTPIQFFLMSMIYYAIIESSVFRRVIVALNIIFPIYCTLNALFIESFWFSSPTIPITINHIAAIVFSIYFLYSIYVRSEIKYPTTNTHVILVLSLFFYYASTLVQEMTFNLIGYNKDLYKVYNATICFVWIIHIALILFAIRIIYKDNYGNKKNSLNVKQSEKSAFL